MRIVLVFGVEIVVVVVVVRMLFLYSLNSGKAGTQARLVHWERAK